MAMRRPFNPSAGPMASQPQQPRPGMTMAPSPQGAQPGMGTGMAPGSGAPQPAPAPVPLPIQPSAGGPTSPFNIQSMLEAKMGGGPASGGAQPPTPLPPWGDSHGDPGASSPQRLGYGGGDAGAGDGMGLGDPAKATDMAGAGADAQGEMSPLVMMRLLMHLGKIPNTTASGGSTGATP